MSDVTRESRLVSHGTQKKPTVPSDAVKRDAIIVKFNGVPTVDRLPVRFNTKKTPRYEVPCSIEVRGGGGIRCSIEVRQKTNHDMDSTISVRHEDLSEIQGSVTARQNKESEKECSITVRQTIDDDKTGTITVRRNELTEIVGSITARQNETSDLRSAIRVRSQYIHDGDKYGLDMRSVLRVSVTHSADMSSWIGIKYRTKMTGDSVVIGVAEKDIESSIIVHQPFDMPSSIGVAPYNRMTGIVNIVEPITFRDTLIPVKDSFVREGLPRLNYGGEQILGTGYSAGRNERLRTLMGFDINNFISQPTEYELKKAELRVYFAYLPPTIGLSLYETTNDWMEYGVTWENQPETGELVSTEYTINNDEKYISFDISEFVFEARQLGKRLPNFYLTAQDETETAFYLFSKERGAGLEPKVVIEYFDGRIWSFDTSNLPSSIRAVIPAKRDLPSRINVFAYFGEDGLPSRVFIAESGHGFRQLESSAYLSRPDLFVNVTVRQSDWSELPSSISVREAGYDELENNTITVSKPYLPSTVLVKTYLDIPSNLHVRVEDYRELDSIVTISAATRPGSIYVIPYKDWKGTISVRRERDNDTPSTIILSLPELFGSLEILNRDDLEGSIEVKVGEWHESEGKVIVTKPSLPSSVRVAPYIDVPGNIRVRRYDKTEIDGYLALTRPDLLASVYVKFTEDLEGSISVRKDDDYELDSKLTVSRPSMQGSIHPKIHFDIESSISVRRTEDSEPIEGSIYVRFRKDLPGSLDVWHKSDLPGTIRVRSPYLQCVIRVPAYDESDLQGKLIVRLTREEDVPSTVDVKLINELPSEISVRQDAEFDVPSRLTVRRSAESAIPSSIDIMQLVTLPSQVAVRREDKSEIECSIHVLDRGDIPSKITVPWRSSLPGSILVVYGEHKDLPGTLLPRVRGYYDIQTTLMVVMEDKSDLRSSIRIPPNNKMTGLVGIIPVGDSDIPCSVRPKIHADLDSSLEVRRGHYYDMPSQVAVRNDGFDEIPCSVHPKIHADLECTISVRQTECEDLECKIIVRQRNASDLPCTIQARIHSNLPCTIYVLHRSDLECTIEVVTAYPYAYIM